jgi:hypothetical protein
MTTPNTTGSLTACPCGSDSFYVAELTWLAASIIEGGLVITDSDGEPDGFQHVKCNQCGAVHPLDAFDTEHLSDQLFC